MLSLFDSLNREHFSIRAIQDHRVAASDKCVGRCIGMVRVENTALVDHRHCRCLSSLSRDSLLVEFFGQIVSRCLAVSATANI